MYVYPIRYCMNGSAFKVLSCIFANKIHFLILAKILIQTTYIDFCSVFQILQVIA